MSNPGCLAVILAAGHGTRFKSRIPKVLHQVASRSLVAHVAAAAVAAGATDVSVVVGPDDDGKTIASARATAPNAVAHVQVDRLGTAHAALAAREAMRGQDHILFLLGDTPLIGADTIGKVRAALAAGAGIAVLGFRTDAPTGYGRLLVSDGDLVAIREERDASDAERLVTFCNSGLMGVAGGLLPDLLERVGNHNAQGEYYLPDIVELARSAGHRTVAIEGPEHEARGINDRVQLAACEARYQAMRRHEAMRSGVTLRAPETVMFSADTVIEPDVEIEPNVVFAAGVHIATGARIRSFTHIERSHIGEGAIVGPYARLRPGTRIGPDAHVGNFVELKNTELGAGSKANHLSYVGDTTVGSKSNIGAGTITCNYDGFNKYRTWIGSNAFIGSNSSLIAPVSIADDACVASGSVVTKDVGEGELALARGRQVNKPGWVEPFRADARARKEKAARARAGAAAKT